MNENRLTPFRLNWIRPCYIKSFVLLKSNSFFLYYYYFIWYYFKSMYNYSIMVCITNQHANNNMRDYDTYININMIKDIFKNFFPHHFHSSYFY